MSQASANRQPAATPIAATEAVALNVDLHCHSLWSDGTLAPATVVERAWERGVQLLALTDHDEIGGLAEAAGRARELGLAFIPGVEISVTWARETIHVVGLRVDPLDEKLSAGLARIRAGRDARARQMSDQLAAVGVPDALEGASRYVRNPGLISRSHFARYLVEAGFGANVQQVFDRYLLRGRPGYVAQHWADLDEAIDLIVSAGGVAVLAHPGRYRLDDKGETSLWALVEAFRDAGGRGIEVISSSHRPADRAKFARWSSEFGLAASLGSDFHDPKESRVDLGTSPRLSASLEPVWRDWPETRALVEAAHLASPGPADLAGQEEG